MGGAAWSHVADAGLHKERLYRILFPFPPKPPPNPKKTPNIGDITL